ncbi:type II secretion system inner membrane protein GspF [Geomonas sp. Red69]|uniref:General secretion pathway protein F n=1 Tax=Geomonas diazotrophica TaxID=2843197 RepID=A0ABX8JL45_9BACT|nr:MULTISPECIES: type II secretion system inner membrane protein GspF [Geomonas]MBU5635714.1 type II secretion system inner membrane protein GspF [Geomonas diazotrophica]QWV98047.1 type II secretion system inner membrane protein GspF [Geomonas nitrogeniifigens]QXE87178.1 type II secretion system inner membrane protein GspF [Geomonas nitrogeniifigens]
MPTFRYSAFNQKGAEVAGTVDAASESEARLQLKQKGLFAKEIAPAAEAGSRWSFNSGVSVPDLSLATRRLATLLGSAVPVYEAVATLWEQEAPGELKRVLGRVRDRLAEGQGLAQSLAAEPQVFSESYIGMVAAGEASGALEVVLERLAEFQEDQAEVRSRVITALIYPAIMVVVGIGVMMVLLGFVVPKISAVFESNKATLPLVTVLLIKASTLVRKGWWIMGALALGAVAAWKRAKANEEFLQRRDRFLLKLPMAGQLWRRLVLSRFAKVLGLLLQSGVPIIKAMEITGEAVVNREYKSFLAQARETLIQGGSLSATLKASPLFPPLLTHMTAVGEKSGELDAMLIKAGDAFQKEFNAQVTRSMALLEPMLILGMGLTIGFMVIAVLLPIMQLNQLVK